MTTIVDKAICELQPDELNELKATVKDFMRQIQAVDDEVETLKGDRKEIIEEFSDRLDMRTLQLALRVIKLQSHVAHRDTFDTFMNMLNELE
jgi:uncharacterized protein (UPF0335 family)